MSEFWFRENSATRSDPVSLGSRVYRANLSLRLLLMGVCYLLGGGGLSFLAFCIQEYCTDNPGRTTPLGMAIVVTIVGGWSAFWCLTGISAWWLGRLELQEGRALLPRFAFFPWSYLPAREMPLLRVSRWGIGTAGDPAGLTHGVQGGAMANALVGMMVSSKRVLVFEVGDNRNPGRKTIMHIAVGTYPKADGAVICRYFEENLGAPLEAETHWLWGVQLPSD